MTKQMNPATSNEVKKANNGDGVFYNPININCSNINTMVLGTPGVGKAFRAERV